MDLTTAISNFQRAGVMSDVQMRVARKMLDVQELQGAAIVRLIEAAGQTASTAGDQMVAAATGLGGQIDVHS
jgi:hypothetical protein